LKLPKNAVITSSDPTVLNPNSNLEADISDGGGGADAVHGDAGKCPVTTALALRAHLAGDAITAHAPQIGSDVR